MKLPPFKEWHTERITWLGGFVLAIASTVVALAMGNDIPGGVVAMVTAMLGTASVMKIGKRVTQWKPTEEAHAHRIRNGLGDDDGIDH